jgi:hypothetical protein
LAQAQYNNQKHGGSAKIMSQDTPKRRCDQLGGRESFGRRW